MSVVDVMMGRANQVPYDMQSEQAEVQRRALLMQQLLQSTQGNVPGLVPGTATGGIAVPNYAGALGKVLESVIGSYGQQNLATQQAEVARRTQEIGGEEARRYMQLAQGGLTMGAGPGGETTTAGPDSGMARQYGVGAKTQAVREMAMAAQKEKDKRDIDQTIGDKDLLDAVKGGHLLPSTVVKGAPVSSYSPMPHINVVDNVINQTTPGQAQPTVPPRAGATYGNKTEATTTMPATQQNLLTEEIKPLGVGNLRQDLGTQFNLKEQEARLADIRESKGKALSAVSTLQATQKAKELIATMNPQDFGPAADWITSYNNFLTELGAAPLPANTKREELNTLLSKNVMDHIRLYAPVSNYDEKKLSKSLGSEANSLAGLGKILNTVEEFTLPVLITHNKNIAKTSGPQYGDMSYWEVNPADYGLKLPTSSMGQTAPAAPGAPGIPVEPTAPRGNQVPLTGSAAMAAMPPAQRQAIEAEREASPNTQGPVTYTQPPIARFPTAAPKAPNPQTASDQEIIEYLRRQREQRGQRR